MPTTRIRVRSLNLRHSLSGRKFRADLRRALAKPGTDVVALQECANRWRWFRKHFAAWRDRERLPGRWEVYAPGRKHRPARQTPIAYRADRYEFVHGESVLLHRVRPRWFPSSTRYATLVVLRDRATGAVVAVVNGHTVPNTLDRKGRPKRYRRVRLARAGYRVLASLCTTLERSGDVDAVVLVGDLNADHVADWRTKAPGYPADVFPDAGALVAWHVVAKRRGSVPNTRDSRTLDVGYAWGRVRLAWARVMRGLHTDHDSPEFAFDVTF